MAAVNLSSLASRLHWPEFPIVGNHIYVGAETQIMRAIVIADGAVTGVIAAMLIDIRLCPAGALPDRIALRGDLRGDG